MKRKQLLWSEILRHAVQADGRTQAELAGLAGLTKAQLSRFVAGKRGLMLDSAGRLGAVLGLRIGRPA